MQDQQESLAPALWSAYSRVYDPWRQWRGTSTTHSIFPDIDDTGEIQLGDVGIIFEGRFLRLFNITVPSDSLLNTRSKFGSPEQFEPFEPANVASRELVVYQDIGESVLQFSSAMRSRDRFGRHVSCTAQLVIGPNARTIHLPTSTAFEDYVASNHRAWFAHVEAIGLDCEPSDLVCISGFTKGSNLDLRVETREPSWSSRSERPSIVSRHWPPPGATKHTASECAGFIEFYRIQYRPTPEDQARVAARRELHSWCTTEGGEDRTAETPLDDLLKYLLRVCQDATAAMASHQQLYSLFDSRGFPGDLPAFFRHVCPSVRVRNGVAMLDPDWSAPDPSPMLMFHPMKIAALMDDVTRKRVLRAAALIKKHPKRQETQRKLLSSAPDISSLIE